jgi:hypothetical protein
MPISGWNPNNELGGLFSEDRTPEITKEIKDSQKKDEPAKKEVSNNTKSKPESK